MKNHDLLDAIGEVSEETVRKYALPDTSNSERAKEEDIMDTKVKQPISQTKKKPFRIHAGAVAAAIALCLGLNAAIIFGVNKMKQDAAGITSGSQIAPVSEPDHPYMEIYEASETQVTVRLRNPTDEEFSFNPEFAVMDGDRIIPAAHVSTQQKSPFLPKQTDFWGFSYEALADGTYLFVNLNEDGTVSDSFEPVEFKIPTEWIIQSDVSEVDISSVPDMIGLDYDDAVKMYGHAIQIEMFSQEYSAYEAGKIFDQDVVPGEPLSENKIVNVKVSLGPKKVLLPDVTEWDFETARSTIVGLGLLIDKRMSYSTEVPQGKVISTDPEGPVEIEPGSYVRVTVSLGLSPDTVPVPNFINMKWDYAKTVAESLKLELVKKQIGDEAEEGTVLNQNVQPNEEVSEGTVIELTVSTGAGYEGGIVPNFTGMQWDKAKMTADALKIAVAKKEADDDAPAGSVIAQDVDAGTVPDENMLVTLTVSNGQMQEAVRIIFNIPAGISGKYHIGLYEAGVAKAIGETFEPEKTAGVTSLTIEGKYTEDFAAILCNDENGKEAVFGTYRVDFEKKSYETLAEHIEAAFNTVQ